MPVWMEDAKSAGKEICRLLCRVHGALRTGLNLEDSVLEAAVACARHMASACTLVQEWRACTAPRRPDGVRWQLDERGRALADAALAGFRCMYHLMHMVSRCGDDVATAAMMAMKPSCFVSKRTRVCFLVMLLTMDVSPEHGVEARLDTLIAATVMLTMRDRDKASALFAAITFVQNTVAACREPKHLASRLAAMGSAAALPIMQPFIHNWRAQSKRGQALSDALPVGVVERSVVRVRVCRVAEGVRFTTCDPAVMDSVAASAMSEIDSLYQFGTDACYAWHRFAVCAAGESTVTAQLVSPGAADVVFVADTLTGHVVSVCVGLVDRFSSWCSGRLLPVAVLTLIVAMELRDRCAVMLSVPYAVMHTLDGEEMLRSLVRELNTLGDGDEGKDGDDEASLASLAAAPDLQAAFPLQADGIADVVRSVASDVVQCVLGNDDKKREAVTPPSSSPPPPRPVATAAGAGQTAGAGAGSPPPE